MVFLPRDDNNNNTWCGFRPCHILLSYWTVHDMYLVVYVKGLECISAKSALTVVHSSFECIGILVVCSFPVFSLLTRRNCRPKCSRLLSSSEGRECAISIQT